jgi:hypothetical protein
MNAPPSPCPVCGASGGAVYYVKNAAGAWLQCAVCQARGPRTSPDMARFLWDRRRPAWNIDPKPATR